MKNSKLVIWLQGFNAVTAIAGGLALITGSLVPPDHYLQHTSFDGYYMPGVILLCTVGGSALFATIALYKKLATAPMISILAGVIMLFWIICEVASIRTASILQLVYVITSITIIIKTPTK